MDVSFYERRYKMAQQVETIVLRFRDLVTEENETISKHKEIIEEKGFVWWAWWKKGAEVTPIAEFSFLSNQAKENSISIYLLDSGQDKLYKAKCDDIESRKNTPINSPERDHTPVYYKEKAYFAWFKFFNIEECDAKELNAFSYLDSDSLFNNGETDYSLFFNKKVFNTAELIQQNRTVWFLRNFENGDKENEIILLNANIVQPSIYSGSHLDLSGNTFLWLSDLHFSNDVLSVKTTTPNKTSLTGHIQSCAGIHFKDISALIVSGDITNCCKAKGFELAENFISDLNRENSCRLDSDNIVICPGNHDLMRINSEITEETPKLFSESENTYDLYSKFFKNLYHISPNEFLTCGRKFLTPSGKSVEIAALNTVMLQQYENFEGHGYVSAEQLKFVEKSMGWTENNKSSNYRIVVMHHHYCPACLSEEIDTKKPSSVVYDADRLMQWLVKNDVKLLLHGHKHNKFFSKVSYPKKNENNIEFDNMHDVYVVSAGGLGATNTEHTFGTITFGGNDLVINIYKIHPDNIDSNECIQTISIPMK